MTDAKSTTPALPQRFTHVHPSTKRDEPDDVVIQYTTKPRPACVRCGAAMELDELPTAEERRAAAAEAKGRARGTRSAKRTEAKG